MATIDDIRKDFNNPMEMMENSGDLMGMPKLDFEIKNNFISPIDQQKMSPKFGRQLQRNGNMIGTETVIEDGSLQPVENLITSAPNIMDEPISIPGEDIKELI